MKHKHTNTLLQKLFFPFILIDRFFALLGVVAIKLYQKTLSPDHGPLKFLFSPGVCRFHPTCSMYGIDALRKKGFTKGVPLIISRIFRCNPWSHGGHDPVKD